MRTVSKVALAVGVALIAVLIVTGGSNPYTLNVRLANADGLESGSPVAIGGVEIGQVNLQVHQQYVDVELQIDRKYAPVDRAVTATILARNALGQKEVLLSSRVPGAATAPDGFKLPLARVDAATDLDQLLSTLDPDTRSRLAIFLDQAGLSFAGRKLDFRALLNQLSRALSGGTDVLRQLTTNNLALTNLLDTSDQFIGTLAGQRRLLSQMIDLLGRTTETVAAHRAALASTLVRAPTALASARTFLAELQRTTGPLAATARLLTRSAPPLLATVAQLRPFQAAVNPTLISARAAAPTVRALANRTAVPLAGAVPALSSIQAASQQEIPGVGYALSHSMDNLLGTVDNWAHAIQFRDGLSHVFRGEASFAPGSYEAILNRLGVTLPTSLPLQRPHGRSAPALAPAPAAAAPAGAKAAAAPVTPTPALAPNPVSKLLGGLLGTGGTGGGGGTGGTQSNGPPNLSSLLHYLLGK